ncbi:MAG: cell envelope integrity protein TolA [Bacteroidetes bacterium]|nr:cell envelope integrity protein TolA [Bacteroidota bacterium]
MKYRINKNQPPLTDADLRSARDFQKLLHSYRAVKVPFYRTGRFFAGSSAVIVATAVTLVTLFSGDKDVQNTYITPPVAQVDIARDSFIVDADSVTDLTYASGSQLHVPAGAFRTSDGKNVSGKVTLRYREFHDQKDIFLSGIPMTYDSAGQQYVFESAGMMEITAWQNGKELTANPDKPIEVKMVSNTAEDRYNTYYLDTTERKWVNLNKTNLMPVPPMPSADASAEAALGLAAAKPDPVVIKSEQEFKKAAAAVKEAEREKPMPIARADKDKTKFHIVVDANEFPEIAMYQNVRFQVKDELNFDKKTAKTEWEDVKLKKLNGLDYQIEFVKGNRKMEVVATPVVEDKDLPAAQKLYDSKFALYQAKLTQRKQAEEKARKEYEAKAQAMKEKMDKAIAEAEVRERQYQATLGKTQLVYRTLSIYRFGTYNCDSPVSWPREASVVASLESESGEKLDLACLNLIEKDRNAVFPYQPGKGECRNFRFNPSKDNVLWAMTMDNKLAIVDAANFKQQQTPNKGTVKFRFRLIDKDFKTADGVRKYLEI